MIRSLLIYIIAFFTTVIFHACSEDSMEVVRPEDGNLTLTLSCSKVGSRALSYDEEGEDRWNENKIATLECFFYKDTDNDDAQATCHLSISDVNQNKKAVLHRNLSTEIVKSLFPNQASTCRIYVIANLPASTKIDPSKTSINQLKAMQVSAVFNVKTPQPSFVMDSDGNGRITYDSKNNQLTSDEIALNRAASKIALTITEVKEVTDQNGARWTPYLDGMQVLLYNGVSKTTIDSEVFPYTVTEADYADFSPENGILLKSVVKNINGAESTVYEQNLPFYSYASDWNKKYKEAYLLLVVPWTKEGSDTRRNCYYQVPINSELKNLKRNQYYKINLKVSTLGTFEPIKPTEIRPSYVILDWGTHEIIINATLQNYRYLIVTPTRYIVHNQDELAIPYASSHPVQLVNQSCVRNNLSGFTVTQDKITSGYDLQINETNHTIVYKRPLDNIYTNVGFDFTPYVLKFTIQHKPNGAGDQSYKAYKEEIEILQYPAIYVDYERNSDFLSESNKVDDNNKHHGYVFVNGYYSMNSEKHINYDPNKQDLFASAAGIQGFSKGEFSPNRYIFTITSVKGTDYIIGDPRTKKPVTFDGTKWVSAPSLDPNPSNRKLTSYYPTDDSEATRKVIAPRFIIASTYGGLYPSAIAATKLEDMKKRCASYQEDGYPAGRWRLPTEAEFKFIIQLVNRTKGNKLSPIYVIGKSYWCAHGLGTPQSDGTIIMTTPNGGYSVRCVYDEWYWGSERLKDKTKFTWGDKPRDKMKK